MKAFVQHQYKDSDKLVIQALVPFTELNARAIFTQKVLSNDVITERSLYDVEVNADYYQRRLNPVRLKEIKKYIYNAILDEKENIAVSALFPTAMILAVEFEDGLSVIDGSINFEFKDDQRIYIVDGQHRLMAMRQLYEDLSYHGLFVNENDDYIREYLRNYLFNCTILVNYDIWEQGQVFVNVNFKQKPVSRSLYYDVYGAEYVDGNNPKNLARNKIYLAHELTRFMNEVESSPFHRRIRMLGTGKGYVSQSFFVEALLPLFKESGPWRFDPMSQESALNMLSLAKTELFNFFLSISRRFSSIWGDNEDGKVNFICKTTGVGAFTKLMSRLHWQIPSQILEEMNIIKPGQESKKYIDFINKYISPLVDCQEELFGKDSQYGKTGGKGIESMLFKRMIDILCDRNLIETPLNEIVNKSRVFGTKAAISQKYLSSLYHFGIRDLNSMIEGYMNNNLPSEIDALGTHCRVDDVSNLYVTMMREDSEKERVYVEGSFTCDVEINYGSESENSTYSARFPGVFKFCLIRRENSWIIDAEASRTFVNTDSYYK